MSRSLAPSPTAIASAGVRPSRAAISAERLGLGGAAEDRLGDLAGQPAVRLEQPVGAVLVEAEHRGDRRGEDVEAARDQRRPGAVASHGGDQRAAAGGQRQARCDDAVDDGGVEALQQRDALAQRRLEGDLAIHRARA